MCPSGESQQTAETCGYFIVREVLVPIARYMGVVMNCLTRRKGNVEKTLQILLGSSSNPFSLFVLL